MPYEGYHIIPQNDVIVHDQSTNCICRPTRERRNGVWTITHHSLDGREHREPDHDRANCPLCSSGAVE
jgi:hypothetical protein